MKRSISVATLSLLVALPMALTACSQNDAEAPISPSPVVVSPEPSAADPATSEEASPDPMVSSDESPDPLVSPGTTDASAMPSSTSPQPSAGIPSYTGNDATEVCAELSKEASPILTRALGNIDKPSEVSAAYNELADLYEKAVNAVESQEAKDAFASMATAYRNISRDGVSAAGDELNKANEAFGEACFDN